MVESSHASPPKLQDSSQRRTAGREVYILAAFVLLRFCAVPIGLVIIHSDTLGYVWAAGTYWSAENPSEFDLEVARARPPAYPILLRLCGVRDTEDYGSLILVTLVQFIFSGLALGLLAIAMTRELRYPAWRRYAIFAVIALFSLSVYAGPWDILIMTDSLSIAAIISTIALSLWVFSRPRALTLFALAIALTTLVAVRDANVFAPLSLLPSALWIVVSRWRHWNIRGQCVASVCLLFLVALTLTSFRSATKHRRDITSLTNSLSIHTFEPHPEFFDAFVKDYDLPSEMRPLIGKIYWEGWHLNPAYREWIQTFSAMDYAGFLLAHPAFLAERLNAAFGDRSAELRDSASLSAYFNRRTMRSSLGSATVGIDFRIGLSRAITSLLAFPLGLLERIGGHYLLFAVWVGLLIRMCLSSIRSDNTSLALVVIFIFTFVIGQIVMVSLFEGMEDHRHAVLADGLILLTFYLSLIVPGRQHSAKA